MSAAAFDQLRDLLCGVPLRAGDDERTRVARGMSQVLDAYAVYKMGDFDEAFELFQAR